MTIDWLAFVIVLVTALIGSTAVVSLYALGLRLLGVGGRVPVVLPAEFTDQITTITPKQAKKAKKAAAKAAKKNPLTEGQKRAARIAGYACFTLAATAVLGGIYLIVPYFH